MEVPECRFFPLFRCDILSFSFSGRLLSRRHSVVGRSRRPRLPHTLCCSFFFATSPVARHCFVLEAIFWPPRPTTSSVFFSVFGPPYFWGIMPIVPSLISCQTMSFRFLRHSRPPLVCRRIHPRLINRSLLKTTPKNCACRPFSGLFQFCIWCHKFLAPFVFFPSPIFLCLQFFFLNSAEWWRRPCPHQFYSWSFPHAHLSAVRRRCALSFFLRLILGPRQPTDLPRFFFW